MKAKFFTHVILAPIVLAGLVLGIIRCAPFRDSPFSDQILRAERAMNQAAAAAISDVDTDGKIRIAVFADSHQNYIDLDKTIYQINQTSNIDFVVNLGDFTNSGYNIEYDQFVDSYVVLNKPKLSVIGNHDAIGAGPTIFRRYFGESNFWFESASHRYILFNSANLENPDGFKPAWLKEAVESSTKPVFIFSHVNLRDADRFFGTDAQTFTDVINHSKTQLILNGHNHVYGLTKISNTVMLECPRVEDTAWLLLEIVGTQLTITRYGPNGETILETLKP